MRAKKNDISESMLEVGTLGPLTVTWGGQVIPRLGNGKLAALLAYLTTEPGPHRREALADLFWPDLPAVSARLNLRQTLFQLRGLLQAATGQDFLVANRQLVGLAPEAPFRTSSADLSTYHPNCADSDPKHCNTCLLRLKALADAYHGPFLADITLPDCPDFEDWLLFKRDSLHRRALDILARLADCHEQQGHPQAAIPPALRYVELEPWSEAGHLQVMRLYAQIGRPEAALLQYEHCRRTLEQSLGVVPTAELQHFAEGLRSRSAAPPAPTHLPMVEERRQVTVLYAELGTPEIHDPEDALAALQPAMARCLDLVRRFNGHVVQVFGGGLLAYFGFPIARENTALPAMRAALALAAESGDQLSVRVGVHSGLIVTPPLTDVPDAIGTTSTLAIRLRDLADAGQVITSPETRRRLKGYFHFAPLGQQRLPGSSSPMEAFRVQGESGARHRLAAAERLAPFVGREGELAQLLRAWSRARWGEFRALLLQGEAGIGKSRLADALAHRLDNGSSIVREVRCQADARQSPLYPVISLLADLCGITADDDEATRQSKLNGLLHSHSAALAQRGLPLLSRLLGVETMPPPPLLWPQKYKEATRDLLIDLLYSLTTRHPVLLVAEDLHWSDDLTLDLLATLVARQRPGPLLVLATTRPDWQPAWPHLETINLAPLPDADMAHLVGALRTDLAPPRLARIVAQAEGIPLFAEELAALTPGTDNELPATLQELLATRLDSLGPGKPLAQWAATIGRECDGDLLAEVSGLSAEDYQTSATRLRHSGLVQETLHGDLRFKHALIQEAAYQSLSKGARRVAHRRVAEALLRQNRGDCNDRPERLADHWSKAGDVAQAVPLWLIAGHQAAERFAHKTAMAHFEAGLAGLPSLPPGPERDRLEFFLRLGLAQSEQTVAGYGRGRSEELLKGAFALIDHHPGSGIELFQTVWGLWEGAASRVSHGEAACLARRLIDIARAERRPDLHLQGEYALGNSLFWCGEMADSRRHLETAQAMLTTDQRETLRDCYGSIVQVGIKVYLAWVLWFQGHPEQSLIYGEEAVAQARRHDDAYGQAFSLTFVSTLQRWAGHYQLAKLLAEEGKTAARRCESLVFEAANETNIAWSEVMTGHAQAIEQLEQSIHVIRTAMSAVVIPLLVPYAQALLHVGQERRAMAVVNEALGQMEATGDHHLEAELHRLRGLCLEAAGQAKAARSAFAQALVTARRQGAVFLVRKTQSALARTVRRNALSVPQP